MSWKLFNYEGQRKYVTQGERNAFLKTAEKFPREVRTFCNVLAYTGCRISEALALTAERVDPAAGGIIFKSLKKRKNAKGEEKVVYRLVPIPPQLLDTLQLVHNIRESQRKQKDRRLWPWSRTTAWRRVKEVLKEAGIEDKAHAMPKGFRHGLGVCGVQQGVSMNMVQKWLGHAQISTTAIYADAVGEEEKNIASRMW